MNAHFFVKLIPPRSTFPGDITPEEAALMHQHSIYWRGLMSEGRVHVFGPVMDPDGVYGMGVVSAASEDEVRALLADDPAATLITAKISPMQAVLPSGIEG